MYCNIVLLFLCLMITKSRSINQFPTVPLTHIDNHFLQLQSPETTTTSLSPIQSSKILPIPVSRIERTPPDKTHKKKKKNQYPINNKSNETYFVTPHKLFDVSRPSIPESKPVIHQLPSPMGLVDPTSALKQLYQPVGFHYDSDEDDRVSEESSPGGEDALTPEVTGNQQQFQQQQPQQIPPGYATGPISDLQAFLRFRNNSGAPFRMESLTAEQLKATTGNFGGGQSLETTSPSSTEQPLNPDHVQDILNRFKPVMNTSFPQHPMIPTDSSEEEERPFVHLPAQVKTPHPSPGFRKFSIPSTPAASVTSSMTTNPPGEEVRHPMVPIKSYQGMNKFKQTTPSHLYLNRAYTTNVATTVSPDQNFNPQDHSSGNHYGHPDPRYNNGKKAENQSPQTQDYPENEQMNRAPPQKLPPRKLPDKIKERLMKPRDQIEIQEKQDPSSEFPSRDLDQEEKRKHVHYNDNPSLQQHQSNSNNKNNNRGKSGQLNRPSKVKQHQSPTPPSTHVYSHSKYYTMDDDFLSKLTTAADTNKANHAPSEDPEGNDDHIPPSKEGTLSGNVIRQLGSSISGGPAVGLGYGLPPGALHLPHPPFTPPLFPLGPFSPGLLLPPFLPPPPPGPITCCKRYFPQQHILPGLEKGKGIGGGLHGLYSNEVIQTTVGRNEVDTGVTSTTVMASPSSLSKAETFNPASGLDVLSNEIVGKGIAGIPGIPGESFCYQEPVFPHPLYLKQLKLQKLFYPFILKKKLLFG